MSFISKRQLENRLFSFQGASKLCKLLCVMLYVCFYHIEFLRFEIHFHTCILVLVYHDYRRLNLCLRFIGQFFVTVANRIHKCI